MNKRVTYSPEIREPAVRMVLTSEHEHPPRWTAIVSAIGAAMRKSIHIYFGVLKYDTPYQPRIVKA